MQRPPQWTSYITELKDKNDTYLKTWRGTSLDPQIACVSHLIETMYNYYYEDLNSYGGDFHLLSSIKGTIHKKVLLSHQSPVDDLEDTMTWKTFRGDWMFLSN